MITITHKTLNDSTAAQTLLKLSKATGMNQKTAYRIARAWQVIQKETRWGVAEAYKILKKYAVLDERQEVKNFPRGPFEFREADGEKLHDAEMYEIVLNKEIQIPVLKVHVKDIPHGLLSAEDMLSIEWLLDGLDSLEEEPQHGGEGVIPIKSKIWTPNQHPG